MTNVPTRECWYHLGSHGRKYSYLVKQEAPDITDCVVCPYQEKKIEHLPVMYFFLISHLYPPLYETNIVRISNRIKKYASRSSNIFFLSGDELFIFNSACAAHRGGLLA